MNVPAIYPLAGAIAVLVGVGLWAWHRGRVGQAQADGAAKERAEVVAVKAEGALEQAEVQIEQVRQAEHEALVAVRPAPSEQEAFDLLDGARTFRAGQPITVPGPKGKAS